jgi:hypothetical protein
MLYRAFVCRLSRGEPGAVYPVSQRLKKFVLHSLRIASRLFRAAGTDAFTMIEVGKVFHRDSLTTLMCGDGRACVFDRWKQSIGSVESPAVRAL